MFRVFFFYHFVHPALNSTIVCNHNCLVFQRVVLRKKTSLNDFTMLILCKIHLNKQLNPHPSVSMVLQFPAISIINVFHCRAKFPSSLKSLLYISPFNKTGVRSAGPSFSSHVQWNLYLLT